MKVNAKTPSRNLGKLMRSGESATAARQNPNDQEEENNDNTAVAIAEKREIRIQEELAQLDTDSFEQILKNVVNSKTDLLKNVPSGEDPALISIMGLIDDAKERLAAEKELNNTVNTKAPVKFDEVVDFIDDGAEEIVADKQSPTKVIKLGHINVTSPIRGNPIVDLDSGIKMGNEEENYLMKMEQDPISRMEMGQSNINNNVSPTRSVNNPFKVFMVPPAMPEKAIDDVDLEKIRKSQKNNTCDEKEQIAYLKEKGLHEFSKYDNILGPVSKGEFASFSSGLNPVVGCELGVINPVTAANMSVFQTCTPNGRLLPGIPRKFFPPNETAPVSRMRPTPQKAPVTIMLNSTAPSSLLSMPDAYQAQISPPAVPSNILNTVKSPNVEPIIESASKRRKIKKYAKKAEKAALAAAAAAAAEAAGADGEGENKKDDEMDTSMELDDKDLIDDDDEKENGEEGLTREEREARRLKNRKNREKKRLRRVVELKKEAEQQKALELRKQQIEQERQKELQLQQQKENALNNARGNTRRQQNQQQPQSPIGSNSSQEDPNANGPRRPTNGGKNKKTDKNVNSEYTVTQTENKECLERILKELGINGIEDLEDNNGRKKKNLIKKLEKEKQQQRQQNNNNNKQKNQQQKIAPPQSDDESTSEKKMDEVAVAASITKRCSSGAGQQSEEDDDQSYVSAQENLGGSNSRLSTPPAEFVDARQSRDEAVENVMLDPNNYRIDEDVEQLAKQLQQEEDEFITVGKNKKKNKKATETVSASSTASSSSPPNRRNTHPDAKASSTAASSASNVATSSPTSPQQPAPQHPRSNNRPVVHPTTLADFIETTKKDTHKNAKHKKAASGSASTAGQQNAKKQTSFDEPQPASPAFVDAVETPISVNTTPSTFSYADAAKKTSGENTPAHEMSPIPPPVNPTASTGAKKASSVSPPSRSAPESVEKSKSASPPPALENVAAPAQVSFAAAVSGVQLPPSSAAAAAADISFGYEETPEDQKKRQQQKKVKAASPPPKQNKPTRMNGVQLLNAISDTSVGKTKDPNNPEDQENQPVQPRPQPMPEGLPTCLGVEITASWKEAWNEFVNVGPPPQVYRPEDFM